MNIQDASSQDKQLNIFCFFCPVEPGVQVGANKQKPTKWLYIQLADYFIMVIGKCRFYYSLRLGHYSTEVQGLQRCLLTIDQIHRLSHCWVVGLIYLWAPHSFICKCDICECATCDLVGSNFNNNGLSHTFTVHQSIMWFKRWSH